MGAIVEQTQFFLNELKKSELIKNLHKYRDLSLKNNEVLSLVDSYNLEKDNNKKINIKRKLYNIDEYKNYMKYYNDLSLIIFKINRKYQEYIK